jgi:signal transduction histidine kinase
MTERPIHHNEENNFAAVLRHELNNPLTGILGNAELLLAELHRKKLELPPQARARLETIAALAVRMRETVRRLSEEWEQREMPGSAEAEQEQEAQRAPQRVA